MPSETRTYPPSPVPSEDEVAHVILALIAEVQQRDLPQLLDAFTREGGGMPIDSLEAVEILLGLEDRFGIRLPDDERTCQAFHSLGALVERVREVAAGHGTSNEGEPHGR